MGEYGFNFCWEIIFYSKNVTISKPIDIDFTIHKSGMSNQRHVLIKYKVYNNKKYERVYVEKT